MLMMVMLMTIICKGNLFHCRKDNGTFRKERQALGCFPGTFFADLIQNRIDHPLLSVGNSNTATIRSFTVYSYFPCEH